MHYRDHAPPHFHAYYAGDDLAVGIDPPRELYGTLPGRATAMVLDWAALHRAELLDAWQRVQLQLPPQKIDPLL